LSVCSYKHGYSVAVLRWSTMHCHTRGAATEGRPYLLIRVWTYPRLDLIRASQIASRTSKREQVLGRINRNMSYANNSGVSLYWEEQGQGDPLLLIMGLGYTHDMWHRTLPIVSRCYRTISFDNRGVGLSDVPPGPHP